jgi:hypothetical protein
VITVLAAFVSTKVLKVVIPCALSEKLSAMVLLSKRLLSGSVVFLFNQVCSNLITSVKKKQALLRKIHFLTIERVKVEKIILSCYLIS